MNGAHAIDPVFGPRFKSHIAVAHDGLAEVVDAMVPMHLDLLGGFVCERPVELFRVHVEAEEVDAVELVEDGDAVDL